MPSKYMVLAKDYEGNVIAIAPALPQVEAEELRDELEDKHGIDCGGLVRVLTVAAVKRRNNPSSDGDVHI